MLTRYSITLLLIYACLLHSLSHGQTITTLKKSHDKHKSKITKHHPLSNNPAADHQSEHFLVNYYIDHDTANLISRQLELTHTHFYHSFSTAGFQLLPLSQRLNWICFNDHNDFDRYAQNSDFMDMSWLDSYYSARTNRVVLVQPPKIPTPIQNHTANANPEPALTLTSYHLNRTTQADQNQSLDLAKIRHEAAHQLAFNSGLQKRGVMYPLWVSEGLATNFENCDSGSCALNHDNPTRRLRLHEAWLRNNLMPLDCFITLTRIPPGQFNLDTVDIWYSQSWAFFRFFLEHYPQNLRSYLNTLAQLDLGWRDENTLRQEFIHAFGPLESLQKSWNDFLPTILPSDSPQEL